MISIKNIINYELDEVLRVESETWTEKLRASRNKFSSRLEIFPEGFFAAYKKDKMIGVTTSMLINYPNEKLNSWENITNNGLGSGHNKNGNALYIVSLGVSKFHQGKGIGSLLLNKQKELARELGLEFLVLGARIPSYYLNKNILIEDYIYKKNENNELFDPELRFYSRQGLKINKIIANYMKDDSESLNYGIIMIYKTNN